MKTLFTLTDRRRIWYAAILLAIGAAFVLPLPQSHPDAQTGLNTTTLSVAMTATQTTITPTSDSTIAVGHLALIDREVLRFVSEIGTTGVWNIQRGQQSTVASGHAVSAKVYSGATDRFASAVPGGTCSGVLYQPYIVLPSARLFDCVAGFWLERSNDPLRPLEFTQQDSFENGQLIMQDDGTAKSLADAEENYVYSAPLFYEYREDVAKTASSWIAINGDLEISADDAAEGVEIVINASSDAALNQMFEVGTSGGCVAMMATVTIASVDELHIGFRQNEAFADTVGYATYGDWAVIGLSDNAGDLDAQDEEAGAGTQNDDTGITWADGERRGLMVCLSKAGAPSFYYTDASPELNYPVWRQVTTTNTGDALTAGDGMVPFIAFTGAGAAGTVAIQWIRITRFP